MEEANEAELQDLRELLRMLGKIDPWIKAVTTDGSSRPWVADSHSPLSTDDQRTHPYRLSHRTWMAINVAVDFLHCLRRSLTQELQEGQVQVHLHSYAQMALLRGAVENACCAVWLLGPTLRLERVTNRLCLEWHELKPAYRLRELAHAQPTKTIEQRQQQLIDLLIAANFPFTPRPGEALQVAAERTARKTLKEGGDYVEMVKRAGELTPNVGADVAEATWRMCSALAHGDSSATIGLLDLQIVEQVQPGINLVLTTPPVRPLVAAAAIALGLTARAFELLEIRGRALY
ncbi:hypothetical protein [Actinoallomurus sp. CA-142502]|uniref:hypothetical protein n=1 Tax=Actinoallomurus sp. CA-142502 TaxID=3239885 RepID=UPI003D8E36C7